MSPKTAIKEIQRELRLKMVKAREYETNKEYWWRKGYENEEDIINLHKKLQAAKMELQNELLVANQINHPRQSFVQKEPLSCVGERSNLPEC